MIVIDSAGITDIGRKRKVNEDALLLDDDLRLYVVADGMGGHQAGEVASMLVVETIRDHIKRFEEDSDVDEPGDCEEILSKEARRLLSSINMANQGVHRASHSKEVYRGMGSTVSAVYFSDETLMAANVGDSPIYLVQDGSIEPLSVPHTVMAEQAALDPEGAKRLGEQFKHMLTRAVGIEETVKADICEIECFRGDILVISSDGLSDKVSPEEILGVVNEEPPEKACRSLVDLANERGGDDNVTVIVLKVRKIKHERGGITMLISRIGEGLSSLFRKSI